MRTTPAEAGRDDHDGWCILRSIRRLCSLISKPPAHVKGAAASPLAMYLSESARIGIALAKNIELRLREILAAEFPTDSPPTFGRLLYQLVNALQATLHSTEDERLQRFICESLRDLGSDLRYLENAGSKRVPASLIPPVEALLRYIAPQACVVLSADWDYNYSVLNITAVYDRKFRRLLGDDMMTRILAVAPVYIVCIPALEEGNILLHSLLGHEIGHLLASMFVETPEHKASLDAILASVGDLTWHYPNIQSLPQQLQFKIRQTVVNGILEARRRGVEEIVCDLTAYLLFGPSALFAMDYLAPSDLDALPEGDYDFYPPWRLRLRTVYELAQGEQVADLLDQIPTRQPFESVCSAVRDWLKRISDCVQLQSDWEALNADGMLSRAYRDLQPVLNAALPFLNTALSQARYNPGVWKSEAPHLLERLALGVPPDEDEGGHSPDFRSAIVAGWLYRTARLSIPYSDSEPWNADHDPVLNRLVLKAVESIELKRDYQQWLRGTGS